MNASNDAVIATCYIPDISMIYPICNSAPSPAALRCALPAQGLIPQMKSRQSLSIRFTPLRSEWSAEWTAGFPGKRVDRRAAHKTIDGPQHPGTGGGLASIDAER